MKRYLTMCLLMLFSLALFGCGPTCKICEPNFDLTKENWQRFVNRSPTIWTLGASRWFTTGNPSPTQIYNDNAPISDQMSNMVVRVPHFFRINVSGAFKVQLFQTDGHESVTVSGPNAGIRGLVVAVRNGTLCLILPPDVVCGNRVIVRVGVRGLSRLTQMGSGSIEALYLKSGALTVEATPTACGNVYLSGDINLRCVNNQGNACIVVIGAHTPSLVISTGNSGSVNVFGNVAVRSIVHHGVGNVNIIGANTRCLTIVADGCGKIGLVGRVNVQKIEAREKVSVFIDGVRSNYIYTYLCDCAQIGLSGDTCDLYVQAGGNTKFWGRYLCTQNAYVKACQCAHINVSASHRIFASARNNSSVYFFGSPDALSQFVADNGIVMPIYGVGTPCCKPPCRRPCFRGAG